MRSAPKVKTPAADRTLSMFEVPKPPDVADVEAEEKDGKAERVPMEQSADRSRDTAFKYQEWCTTLFGAEGADEDQFRMSRKGDYYFLERLAYVKGVPNAYAHVGVILHKKNLISATKVMVEAARALKEESK